MDLPGVTAAADTLLAKLDEFSTQLTADESEVLAAIFALAEVQAGSTAPAHISGPGNLNQSQPYTINKASPLIDEAVLARLPSMLSGRA